MSQLRSAFHGKALLAVVLLACIAAFGRGASALDAKNDGLYKIDAKATEQSQYFQKYLKKNPTGGIGLQVFAQLMEHIRIRNNTMRIYSAECKLRQEGEIIKGDCTDAITEKTAQPVEIMFDGDTLVILADDYPVYYRKQ